MHNIAIATSIAPREIEKQQKALASWTVLGFNNVVSLNTPEEISLLAPYFPDVTFVPAKRNANELVGRPTIFINDILDFLNGMGPKICGIVNSDVHLIADPGLADFMAEHATGALVYGPRVDIDSFASADGEFYPLGFDYFFFDRSIIDCYPPNDFCMGMPGWDYWMPMVPIMKGLTVRQLVSPVCFHTAHEQNFDKRHIIMFAIRLARDVDKNVCDTLAANFEESVSDRGYFVSALFNLSVLEHILDNSLHIAYPVCGHSPVVVKTEMMDNRRLLIRVLKDEALLPFEDSHTAVKSDLLDILGEWPSCQRAHSMLGLIFFKEGDFNASGEHFEKALEICPVAWTTLYNYGLTLIHLKKFMRAKKLYKNYTNSIRDNQEADEIYQRVCDVVSEAEDLNTEGEGLFGRGDTGGAELLFLQAINICCDFAAAYNNLAVLYWHSGDHEKAPVFFAKAIETDPDYRDAVINFADALKESGRNAEAKSLYVSYLLRHPGDIHISQFLRGQK